MLCKKNLLQIQWLRTIYIYYLTQFLYVKNLGPWLVWLSGLSAQCEPKCCRFDSQSGHMPRLWARSPVWGCVRGNHTLMSLSLSPSLPLSLKMDGWNLLKKKNLEIVWLGGPSSRFIMKLHWRCHPGLQSCQSWGWSIHFYRNLLTCLVSWCWLMVGGLGSST